MAKLLVLAEGRSVMLEKYARELIFQEELHVGEVDKMLPSREIYFRISSTFQPEHSLH